MNDHLLKHAIENIWCDPHDDRQLNFKLSRICGKEGVKKSFWLMNERINLPSQTQPWMVYQLGKVNNEGLNLPARRNYWFRLDDLVRDRLLLTNVFTKHGIQFPRCETYAMLTHGNGFVLAVKINERIASLENEDLYIRFYTNGYFESTLSTGHHFLEIKSKRFNTAQDIIKFQREVADYQEGFKGATFHFVNGRLTKNVSAITAQEGDVAEVIFDPSVTKVVDLKLSKLPTFTSTLDKLKKYLLHYDDKSVQRIDFIDDIDVYLIKDAGARQEGILYHRNEVEWMRMVTHKDYSIPVERVRSFIDGHTPAPLFYGKQKEHPETYWTNTDDFIVRLYIRESGDTRALQPNANRIQELYRLSDDLILDAMVGVNSTVSIWQATNLENSAYCRFMSASPSFVYPLLFGQEAKTSADKVKAEEFVGDIYGYHAAASILAGTPSPVVINDGYRMAHLNYEHWEDATIFEYDKDGLLLGYHYQTKGEWYLVQDDNCTLVEAISGRGTETLTEHYGVGKVNLDKGYNFKVFVTDVWRGVAGTTWRDITTASDRDTFGTLEVDYDGNKQWQWKLNEKEHYGLVRTDKTFLVGKQSVATKKGLIEFTVTEKVTVGDSTLDAIMALPTGQLDIWLNGRALQPGLDYVVKWPRIVISNKEYIDTALANQEVFFRAYSFPDSKNEIIPDSETGFVKYGVLSDNSRIDIYRNKVLRIVIDGQYMTPDRVVYDEDNAALTVENVRNGAPYSIQTPPVVFHDVYDDDLTARSEDDERDQAVSDYLTKKLPDHERKIPDFIKERYEVVSCFSNKLITDLVSGQLNPAGIDGHYSEQDIRVWLADYLWLLEYDVCQLDLDSLYVVVLPHWSNTDIELSYYKYAFLVRALKSCLSTLPDMTRALKIGGNP